MLSITRVRIDNIQIDVMMRAYFYDLCIHKVGVEVAGFCFVLGMGKYILGRNYLYFEIFDNNKVSTLILNKGNAPFNDVLIQANMCSG